MHTSLLLMPNVVISTFFPQGMLFIVYFKSIGETLYDPQLWYSVLVKLMNLIPNPKLVIAAVGPSSHSPILKSSVSLYTECHGNKVF